MIPSPPKNPLIWHLILDTGVEDFYAEWGPLPAARKSFPGIPWSFCVKKAHSSPEEYMVSSVNGRFVRVTLIREEE